MASYLGLIAVIVIVMFIVGTLFGTVLIVARGVKAEDEAAMRRRDSRGHPQAYQRRTFEGPPAFANIMAALVRAMAWRPGRRVTTSSGRRVMVPPARTPQRPARALVTLAAFFLPAADCRRWAEEYRSELYDLASSGAGGLRQLWYALRLLRRTVSMSFALRSPRRRSAAP